MGAARAQSPRGSLAVEQVEELGLTAEGTEHSCALSRRGAGEGLPCGLVVRGNKVGFSAEVPKSGGSPDDWLPALGQSAFFSDCPQEEAGMGHGKKCEGSGPA